MQLALCTLITTIAIMNTVRLIIELKKIHLLEDQDRALLLALVLQLRAQCSPDEQ